METSEAQHKIVLVHTSCFSILDYPDTACHSFSDVLKQSASHAKVYFVGDDCFM